MIGLASKAIYLPGKQTLADVLPPDLYSRYRALKSRHFRLDAGIDRKNIEVAAAAMATAILDHENLQVLRGGTPEMISDRTGRILKKNKIRQTTVSAGNSAKVTRRSLKALGKVMEEARESPAFQQQQIACFEKIVEYFDKDLEPVKKRANAWARGQVDGLINPTPLYGATSACLDPMFDVKDLPAMKQLQKDYPEFGVVLTADRKEMKKTSNQRWIAAAESAIARNASTFGMLTVNEVLDKEGLVEQLRAKGYTIEILAAPAEDN